MNELKWLYELPQVPYGNTGTFARYDEEKDCYFNETGDMLRDPAEYEDCEGYTPFGDE